MGVIGFEIGILAKSGLNEVENESGRGVGVDEWLGLGVRGV